MLDGVDLTLTERRVGVIGLNGSGKSTLARLINALVGDCVCRCLVETKGRCRVHITQTPTAPWAHSKQQQG